MNRSGSGASVEEEGEDEEASASADEEEDTDGDDSPTTIARGHLGTTLDLLVKVAVEKGDEKKVQELLSAGLVRPGSQQGSRSAFKLLSIAAIKNRTDIARLLVSGGCDVNQVSTDGRTALHYAVWNGHYEMVEMLLKAGCDPALHERFGDTLPMMAANHGHVHTLQLLIRSGCDILERNFACDTALHYASRNGHIHCIKLLTKSGADVNAQNSWGYTPLTLAVSQEQVHVAQYLIAQGSKVNLMDKANRTPLHYAVRRNMAASVELLLSSGANPDIPDQHDNTPLIEAVFHNHVETVRLLVQYNCDFNRHGHCAVLTPGTISPCGIALLRHNFKVVEILYSAGCNIRKDASAVRSFTNVSHLFNYLQNEEFVDWLKSAMSSPRSLQGLCRMLIRSELKYEVQHNIKQLPIAPKMISYVSLEY